jgi:hypothetical protein
MSVRSVTSVGSEHEPLGEGVRARAPRRDHHRPDPGTGQDGVKGVGELPGPVADQEAEVRGAIAEVHQEIADLLGGPRPVRIRGDPEDVNVAGADLDDEQAVQALQRDRAVNVEEVRGEHGRGLGVQELPPAHVGVAFRGRRDPQGPQDAADGGRADQVAELEQLTLDPLVAPEEFSVASRSISAVTCGLTGGRPVRCGYVHFRGPGGGASAARNRA